MNNFFSLVMVNFFSPTGNSSPGPPLALVEKIRKLLSLDWEIVVHHSYREANQCANALATYGCNMNECWECVF
jgi:hypothetical protein